MAIERKYGLIGYPLSHTFSPGYFAEKFSNLGIDDAEYKAYPLSDIDMVRELIDSGITGFNVTIPYKQDIIPYLDEISKEALQVGAVNTVKITEGRLVGYNSDVFGLENSLYALIGEHCVEGALILGTGGAAKAAQYVCDQMSIPYKLVSRSKPHLTYDELNEEIFSTHQLIINTTPLGLSPNVNLCPNIPYHLLSEGYFAFDLVYNPKKTLFLTKAEEQGASIMNGLQMLYDQADKSWDIWNM